MNKISMFRKIKLVQFSRYLVLLILIVFSVGAIATNLFGNITSTRAVSRTLANGTIIDQFDDPNRYLNDDIIIPNGSTVTIQGPHNFKSLTVRSGGKITSQDYNRYGVIHEADRSQFADLLFNYSDQRYVFIVRGFLNTGASRNRTYDILSGYFNLSLSDPPYVSDRWGPDDMASIEFYSPVSVGTLPNASIWSGTRIGHAYNDINNNRASFYDSQSTAARPIIPFELRYYNHVGNADFGITTCNLSCGTLSDNKYVSTLNIADSFNASSPTPQIQTYTSWQGNPALSFTWAYNQYARFTSWLDGQKSGTGYSSQTFYRADNYSFAEDQKVVVQNNENFMSNRDTFVEYDQKRWEWYKHDRSTDRRNYFTFWPRVSRISPLASKVDNDGASFDGYPTLSNALFQTMSRMSPTVLNITNDMTVENDGMINLNGKGFALGFTCYLNANSTKSCEGTGPGAGIFYRTSDGYDMVTGPSHAGAGGSIDTRSPTYDDGADEIPVLPGSGSWSNSSRGVNNLEDYYNGYGGGFVSISAGRNIIQSRGIIEATGVGGYVGRPSNGAGGAIVLRDRSNLSQYNGIIVASGAGNYEDGGSGLKNGGGGGGCVYIETSLDPIPLQSNINQTAAEARNSVSELFEGQYSYWASPLSGGISYTYSNMPMYSASGGRAEFLFHDYAYFGLPGRVSIVGPNRGVSIFKHLEAIDRSGSASFDPYSLQINDKIRVVIDASPLTVGASLTITDAWLSTGSSTGEYQCTPDQVGGSVQVTRVLASGASKTYNRPLSNPQLLTEDSYLALDVSETYSYVCTIKKIP